ncbi:HipA domain-containing protein [bacterium]|nr:HipA domain-containing protein [bacterium]
MRCLITYQPSSADYSAEGLKRIDRNLKKLERLPYSADALRLEAAARAEKMSIQGVHPKLSARLNTSQGRFEIVDHGGRFILKPQSQEFAELPENEDLTMKLATTCGIDVPLHFLVRGIDDRLTYGIKRFDREGKNRKVAIEDFAQLSGSSRETKYKSSMEKVVKIVETFCTYPVIEKQKLFLMTLFSFLTGNEDMHLKNFSVIRRQNKVVLSPAYDLLNTTIAIPKAQEEMALPLNAKKRKLNRADLVDYFGEQCLQLNEKTIQKTLKELQKAARTWESFVKISFLSPEKQNDYIHLINHRFNRLFAES